LTITAGWAATERSADRDCFAGATPFAFEDCARFTLVSCAAVRERAAHFALFGLFASRILFILRFAVLLIAALKVLLRSSSIEVVAGEGGLKASPNQEGSQFEAAAGSLAKMYAKTPAEMAATRNNMTPLTLRNRTV
jgi:hypothetical protein